MSRNDLTPPPPSLQQQLLRLYFVPTMRRNHIFGSAPSMPSLQRQASNHKNLNMPTTLPACPSKSLGTFWILLVFVMTLPSRSIFWKIFCLDSLERASDNLTLNCFAFPWKCRALNPVFSRESSNNIFSRSIAWQRPFSFNVSDPPFAIHERNSRCWRPWNGCSHGEGCRRPMGCLGLPRPYGRIRLDTVKQEPRSQQREERRQKER